MSRACTMQEDSVFCCPIHGYVPKDQRTEFHPQLQQARPSSKDQYEAKRRARRKYVCTRCGFTFQGSGSWRQAAEHEREWGHTLIQGTKPVSWLSGIEAVTA